MCATGRDAKQAVEALVPEVIAQTEEGLEIERREVERGYRNLSRPLKR